MCQQLAVVVVLRDLYATEKMLSREQDMEICCAINYILRMGKGCGCYVWERDMVFRGNVKKRLIGRLLVVLLKVVDGSGSSL